jgi:hypothetical protein
MGGGQSTSNGGVCTIAIEGFSTKPGSGNINTGDGTTTGGTGAPLKYGDLITLNTQNGWVSQDTNHNCYMNAGTGIPSQYFQLVVLNATTPSATGNVVMDGDPVILIAFPDVNQALGDCTSNSNGTACNWFYLHKSQWARGTNPWPEFYDASDPGNIAEDGIGGQVLSQYWFIRDASSLNSSNYTNPLGGTSSGPILYGNRIALGVGPAAEEEYNGSYIAYSSSGATLGGAGDFNTAVWTSSNVDSISFTVYGPSQNGQAPTTPMVAGPGTPCTNGDTYQNDGTTTTGSGSSIACKTPGGVLTYSPSTCTVSCAATSDACNSTAPPTPNPLVCTGGANCTNGQCTNPDDVPTWNCTSGVWECQPGSSSKVIMYALIGAGVLIGLMILYLIISGTSGSGDDLQRILSQPQ